MRLHHETIYQFIYREKDNGGELHKHLRIANKPYRKRYGKYDRRGQIVNRVSIDERPIIVDEKSRIGDWEGDTIIGKGHKGALLTLVERKTLYSLIVPLQGKNANQLKDAVVEALEADIYFAHPYASWERGINENTNGLIRQYFPKGADLRNWLA